MAPGMRAVAIAAVATLAGVGCGGEGATETGADPFSSRSSAEAEVEAAIRRKVEAAERNDAETWCRSIYIAHDDNQLEDEFLEPEATFEEFSREQRKSCLNQDFTKFTPDPETLEINDVAVREDRATAMIELGPAGERREGKLFLRHIDGRWRAQISVR
jgi:hypothetical protein